MVHNVYEEFFSEIQKEVMVHNVYGDIFSEIQKEKMMFTLLHNITLMEKVLPKIISKATRRKLRGWESVEKQLTELFLRTTMLKYLDKNPWWQF